MTFKEKYYSIDQSKLPEKAKVYMEEFKKDTKNFTDKEAMKIIMPTLDGFIKKLKESGYESAIKTSKTEKPKKEKVVKKKTAKEMVKEIVEEAVEQPKTTKGQPKMRTIKQGDYMRVAKEIRKEGEPWKDALKRAKDFITTQKEVKKEEAKRQYQKLKEFIEKQPEYYPKDIPTPSGGRRGTTLERDAVRVALPKGKRISKVTGKTYYEYRSNRIDKRRDDYPYLAKGGEVDGNLVVINYGGDRYDGGVVWAIEENGVQIAKGIIDGDWGVDYKGKHYDGLLDLSKGINAKLVNKFDSDAYADGGEVDAIFDDGGFIKTDKKVMSYLKSFETKDAIEKYDKLEKIQMQEGGYLFVHTDVSKYRFGYGKNPNWKGSPYFGKNPYYYVSFAMSLTFAGKDKYGNMPSVFYIVLYTLKGEELGKAILNPDKLRDFDRSVGAERYYADGGMTKRMIALPVGIKEQIEESISMGYDTLIEGMISPKTRGVMLIDKDSNVRGTYPMLYKGAIEEILHNIKGYADGGKIPQGKSLKYFIKNEASAGSIANKVPYKSYKDIDAIRLKAYQILLRDGDREYSLQAYIDLIQEAVLEYEEDKYEMSFADGGIIYGNLRKRFEGYTDEELQIFNGDNEETLKNWNREDAIEEAIHSVLEESDEYAKGGEMDSTPKKLVDYVKSTPKAKNILKAVYESRIDGLKGEIDYYEKGASRYYHEQVRGNVNDEIERISRKIDEVRGDIDFLEDENYPIDLVMSGKSYPISFLNDLNDLIRTKAGRKLFDSSDESSNNEYFDVYNTIYDLVDETFESYKDKGYYKYAKGGELDINKYAGAGMFADGGYVDSTTLPMGVDSFVYFNTEEDGKIIWNIISATNDDAKIKKARNFLAKNQGEIITLKDGTQVNIDSYGQSSRFMLERDLKSNNGIVRVWNEFKPKYWSTDGGEEDLKKRAEKYSIKLAKAYRMYWLSDGNDREERKFDKLVKESQISEEQLDKIKDYARETPIAKQRPDEIHKLLYADGGMLYGNLRKRFEGYTDEELQIFNGDNEETLKNWNREDAIEEAIHSVLEESDEYAKGGYTAKGENYEYVNTFGIPQKDFKEMVDAWHKTDSYDQIDRIESRLVFRRMTNKYGEEKVEEINKYIWDTHNAHEHSGEYAKGGKIGFKGLSDKVAKYYTNKKVPSKYQNLYGKTYDKQEAKEVGDKVASKVYYLQKSKMAKGGEVGNTTHKKVTLIFDGEEHKFDMVFVDGMLEDVLLPYTSMNTPLFDYLEKEFDDWLEYAGRDYEEMYFGEEAIYSKRGAIRGAIEIIEETISQDKGKKKVYNLDKGEVDFMSAFS